MVIGVSVRDNAYEASMANTTARPSGVNRYFGGPSRNTTEVNTQQMASGETSVRTAIPAEPRLRKRHLLFAQQPVSVLDGDGRVVDQDADGERQAAERHDVQRVPEEIEAHQRREDGEGNRDDDD